MKKLFLLTLFFVISMHAMDQQNNSQEVVGFVFFDPDVDVKKLRDIDHGKKEQTDYEKDFHKKLGCADDDFMVRIFTRHTSNFNKDDTYWARNGQKQIDAGERLQQFPCYWSVSALHYLPCLVSINGTNVLLAAGMQMNNKPAEFYTQLGNIKRSIATNNGLPPLPTGIKQISAYQFNEALERQKPTAHTNPLQNQPQQSLLPNDHCQSTSIQQVSQNISGRKLFSSFSKNKAFGATIFAGLSVLTFCAAKYFGFNFSGLFNKKFNWHFPSIFKFTKK
jgi:hypothetical protein